MEKELIIAIIFGILGALAKDIFVDNKIQLPKKNGEEIILGSIGGMIIGAIVGVLLDGSAINAFMAGFTGISIISSLANGEIDKIEKKTKKEQTKEEKKEESIEERIRTIAREYGVDEELAVRVAKAESSLDPLAINKNSPQSIDRGLYQINSFYHPEVTDEQAFDVDFSTRFFCQAVKDGNLNWWNASRKIWDKENT